MRAALWLVALFGVAVAIALFAGSNPGTVTLFWAPHRIDLSLNLALLLLLALFVVMHYALRALQALFALPGHARRWRLLQKERALHAGVIESLLQLMTGRYRRAVRSAEQALQLEERLREVRTRDDSLPRHLPQLRALAHLIAAESAQALRDANTRSHHLQAVQVLARTLPSAAQEETLEATYLFAARWALAERDAPEALRWLDSLRQGAARRTLALRLRLKAARLGHQPEVALDTARLLAKHGAFAESAAQTLRRELAILALDQTRDASQLQKCWARLDPQDRSTPEVAQRAARLWLSFEGEPSLALKWLEPLWQRMLQQPGTLDDTQRSRTAHLLAEVLGRTPPDSQWLANIERARQAYPRWVELQYLAGMVCWQHALWGKAQQMLQQAAPHLHEPEMRRNAWRTLALLAEQRDDLEAAQPLWRRAAEA